MPLETTPAVLLRAHPYSESSRILRFFTRDFGVAGTLARGVRKRGGREGSGLETFAGGILTIYVKPGRELHNFKDFESVRTRRGLGASPLRLGAASVLAELILRHAGEEGNRDLFEALGAGLDRLEGAGEAEVLPVLLSEAWAMVSLLGYQPSLDSCVDCGRSLGPEETGRFDFPAGGVRCAGCSGTVTGPRVGPGARAQLHAMISRDAPGSLGRPRAHLQLLSDFVAYHVSGTYGLESVTFLAQMLPPEDA